MQFEEYNDVVRELTKELISDGYSKYQICKSTLGSQSGPQFEGFIKEKNLGIKPLSRMINNLEYELHLVPIPKDDTAKKLVVDQYTDDFVENLKFNLVEYLESVKQNSIETRKKNKESIFDSVVAEMLKQL